MDQFIDQITIFLDAQNMITIYVFLFVITIIKNLCPPLPGDILTAFGGFLAGTGRLNFSIVLLVTTLGSATGFMIVFFLGRLLGHQGKKFFAKKNYKLYPASKIAATQNLLSKYGYFIIIINRFIVVLRSVASLVAGMSKLSAVKVAILCTISAALWNLMWMWAGFYLGNNWDAVRLYMSQTMGKYNTIIIMILVSIVLTVFITVKIIKFLKKRVNDINYE